MINNKTAVTILKWLTSIGIAVFYILNAVEKIFQSNEITKPGFSNTIVILVGIILLVAVALFLINRTLIIGAVILASYMTFVVFVHIKNGKPFLLTSLIVLVTIFAGYLRKNELFTKKKYPGLSRAD
jgi:hypothetical protein